MSQSQKIRAIAMYAKGVLQTLIIWLIIKVAWLTEIQDPSRGLDVKFVLTAIAGSD